MIAAHPLNWCRVRMGGALWTVLLVVTLSGCAGVGNETAGGDIKTESDKTEVDRRAAIRLELAAAYFERGQFTTALDEVKLSLAAKPEQPAAHSLRGLIYAAMGEPKLAEEGFRRALQLAPRDGDTLQQYGWFLCQERRYAEADQMFGQALAQPQYRDASRALLAQGVCLARAGQWVPAQKALMRAHELDPGNPVVSFNLADVLLRNGDAERARFHAQRLNSRPDWVNAQTLWLSARVEHKLGNLAAARVFGQQLRERFAQSAEAQRFERGQFED
jgi:type IV pilus assembly protein PilF